jgi:hypothetical protein
MLLEEIKIRFLGLSFFMVVTAGNKKKKIDNEIN